MPVTATGEDLRIYTQGYEDDGDHRYDRNDLIGKIDKTCYEPLYSGGIDTCHIDKSGTGDFTLGYQIKYGTTPDMVCPLP